MTVQTDPNMLVFVPVGLEKRINVGLRVNGGLPFFIDFFMAGPALLGPYSRNSRNGFIIGNRFREIFAKTKDDPGMNALIPEIKEGHRQG
jgi:hypothetical protein